MFYQKYGSDVDTVIEKLTQHVQAVDTMYKEISEYSAPDFEMRRCKYISKYETAVFIVGLDSFVVIFAFAFFNPGNFSFAHGPNIVRVKIQEILLA